MPGCEHQRGMTYDVKDEQQLCYWKIGAMDYKEWSFVNMPADYTPEHVASIVAMRWVDSTDPQDNNVTVDSNTSHANDSLVDSITIPGDKIGGTQMADKNKELLQEFFDALIALDECEGCKEGVSEDWKDATVHFFPISPSSSAAVPTVYITRLSTLWICAVFTAEPMAIPRSAIRTAQFGPVNGVVRIVRFVRSSASSAHVENPHAPQLRPTTESPFTPIMTQASLAAIFCASRRKNERLWALPNAVIFFASAFNSLPSATCTRMVSTPFAFGAVRAASAIRPVTVDIAVFSTLMGEYG